MVAAHKKQRSGNAPLLTGVGGALTFAPEGRSQSAPSSSRSVQMTITAVSGDGGKVLGVLVIRRSHGALLSAPGASSALQAPSTLVPSRGCHGSFLRNAILEKGENELWVTSLHSGLGIVVLGGKTKQGDAAQGVGQRVQHGASAPSGHVGLAPPPEWIRT